MKIASRLSELIKLCASTTKEIASITGQSNSNLLNKLSRDNLRLSEIEEILNALGYSDIQIVARCKTDTVIISDDDVIFNEHSKYMMFDENKSLLEDIEQNGFRDRKFKELVLDLIEPALQPKFGDLWETYVPKGFEDGFKAVVANQISFDDFYDDLITLKTNTSSNEKEDK